MNLSEDYFSKNYFSDEKFSDFFEESNYDSKVLYFRRVFRRHHVANDPVNWTDPTGLIRDPRDIFDEALNHPDSSSGTNGPGNAFQHCFASCMMAGENGSATAAALGAGFEFINNLQGQKGDAYCMDTNNNQVGRDLAKENGISNLTGISNTSHRGVSSACAQACSGANSSGRLVNLGGR